MIGAGPYYWRRPLADLRQDLGFVPEKPKYSGKRWPAEIKHHLAQLVEAQFEQRNRSVHDYVAHRLEFEDVGMDWNWYAKFARQYKDYQEFRGWTFDKFVKEIRNRVTYFFLKASDPAPRRRCWGEWPIAVPPLPPGEMHRGPVPPTEEFED